MGVRKNAKQLSDVEKESFVQACVLMKADMVTSAYSKWDELVLVHLMIQRANTPTATNVNFGHGGLGSYGFLSWHRYFLYVFERQLQTYVPGVMLPYWDWTDPTPLLTDTFLGPNGDGAGIVRTGYFAATSPGTAPNTTLRPAWWPASLTNGWRLLATPATTAWTGPLQRDIGGTLPSQTDMNTAMTRTDFSSFQNTLEAGAGLASFHQMHNGLHGYIGGHMSNPRASPFDPIFYLHHCNIDRLWAMWQLDGHATEYPSSGARPGHEPGAVMWPWVGGAAGYSSGYDVTPVTMPAFASDGVKRNSDTLDHRALGYTYDTMPIIGVGLDRTGSMMAMTPDPMTTTAPDVTKWEAAKRGVSAFLHDCETVYLSRRFYVTAGIETFHTTPFGPELTSVFAGAPHGLIKAGTSYSQATFDGNVASLAASGGTPLYDALQDVQATYVDAPFAGLPADEQRYVAFLTDGIRTTGSASTSIDPGAFARTAIFAMGFGTGADVDYGTLADLVLKGRTLPTTQVFHGESAGTIDKFFTNALARAMGYTEIFDPVVELFADEHVHFDLDMTSAEDSVFLTAQGMDFVDDNWRFHLMGPDGYVAYAEAGHGHGDGGHATRRPSVTATRGKGRLTLLLHRDTADASAWVGRWRLMAAYQPKGLGGMVMPDITELTLPVAAGPIRGPRHARLLQKPSARVAARTIKQVGGVSASPPSTNRQSEACTLLVNVYAATRLRVTLAPKAPSIVAGEELAIDVNNVALVGNAAVTRTFARLVSPTVDLRATLKTLPASRFPKAAAIEGVRSFKFDPGLVLASLEREARTFGRLHDAQVNLVSHGAGPLHVHERETKVPGQYHFGVYVMGVYCPHHGTGVADAHGTDGHVHGMAMPASGPACSVTCRQERYSRVLTVSTPVLATRPRKPRATRAKTRNRARRRAPRG